jgi:solute carrier family 25 iron transporter 28/37
MYEIVKAATLDERGEVTAYGSALAGGAAVMGHDLILGPLDTVKQRLQLGYYKGLTDALSQMIRNEGAMSLLRSFPITLATNIPYGMIMVGTNEFLKDQWTRTSTIRSDGGDDHHHHHSELTLGVTLGASSAAGLVAAATTTPLDRIKTYLQTQQLAPSCLLQQNTANANNASCPYGGKPPNAPIVADWRQAAIRIHQREGTVGFFRGMTPRILSHTPAVAISWTTYETFKRYLQQHFVDE